MNKVDLFDVDREDPALHPNYLSLLGAHTHAGTRVWMNEIYGRMGDPNGNFQSDFQRAGFHARLFELACFAYLESAGAELDRSYPQPDFLGTLDGIRFGLESTTANVKDGEDQDISGLKMKRFTEEELTQSVYVEAPKRLYNRLISKMKKEYHTHHHCEYLPIVFAVGPYFAPGSVFNTDIPLMSCLYGWSEPGTPDFGLQPFFHREEAEHVSAVLYCNQFTVPRFWRLGPDGAALAGFSGFRRGHFLDVDDNGRIILGEYCFQLGDKGAPTETWSQGVSVFHNPNAKVPLPIDLLPSSSMVTVEDGELVRGISGFHPLTSVMLVGMLSQKDDVEG